MEHVIRFALILALAAVPFSISADDTVDQEPSVVRGEPGPVILTFWGAEYVVPGFWAAEGTVESQAEIGLYGTDITDSPDMAAEYYDHEDGPTANVTVASHQKWGSLYFLGAFQSSDTNAGELTFDLKRILRTQNFYETFIHRLGHDPMHNLESTSTNGKVVWHTDLDPDQEYDLDYSVLDSRTELQLPSLRPVTFGFTYRDQRRDGHRQAFTTSHCDNCHIYSQKHALDEKTTDATIDAKVSWRGGFAKASLTTRELRHGTPSVPITFDDALHPELQAPVFDNRLQFDSDVGQVPADLWPDSDKDRTRVQLVFTNVLGMTVNANGVWSQTENRFTGLKSDYSGYVLSAARGWKSGWRFRWNGRIYTIDNDDIFVDVNDRPSIAGPHAGQTYEDVYGIDYDFVRTSTLDRDVFESRADVSKRLGRKGGTLRFQWNYDTIDRENYEVMPGEHSTTTNLLGASYRVRPLKGWNLEANLKYADVENAFTLINGACSTLVSARYTNPWNPETPQYDEFHQARIADTSASASSWARADLRLGYTTGTTTIFGKYIYYDGDNTDGDLADWSKTTNTALLTVWSAPTEHFNWYATYTYLDSDLGLPACIPIFDG